MRTSFRVRLFVGVAGVAGAATLILALLVARREGVGRPAELMAFAGALALSWAFPLLLFRKEETEALQLDEAFLVTMALLLPAPGVVVAFAVGVGLGHLARRRSPIRAIFNVGQSITAAGLAVLVMRGFSESGAATGLGRPAGAALGAVAFFLVQAGAVSGVIALAERRSYRSAFFDGIGIRLMVWVGNVSVGLLAGLVGSAYPWAVAFAAIPVGVLQMVFAGHLRAHHDRERMNGLFDTAVMAHASMGIGDVEAAIAEAARGLLRCEHARIDREGPAGGELGAHLVTRGEDRWLIVSERLGVEPLDSADRALIEAIAAIGAVALENAGLFKQAHDEREKLADVVGSSSDGIFTVDSSGCIATWNPAMESITGFSSEEMVGTRHLGALRPRDLEGHDVMINGWAESATRPPTDLQIVTTRGEARWLNCTFSPLSDGGYVTVARDFTARKQIEELKDDFVATVSHELRTPLTPIKGFLYTLMRTDAGFSESEQRQMYERMLFNAERLERLVEDLLSVSRLESGRLAVETGPVDVTRVADEIVRTFRESRPNRVFRFTSAAPACLAVSNDARLEQVICNLVENAIRYSADSQPIEVFVKHDGNEITLSVRDRGPGIPLDEQEKVFDRFFRGGHHLTRESGGAGLGLFIARRLTEAMGGRLSLDSVFGSGSTFVVRLPASRQARASAS